ncbi:MAG: multiheme c-type cytochrome [Planctomycetota bacterium]
MARLAAYAVANERAGSMHPSRGNRTIARTLLAAAVLLSCLPLVPACGADPEALAQEISESEQSCRECHRKLNPGLIADLEASPHERIPVTCEECHGSDHDEIFAVKGAVPPSVCARCHEREYEEFRRSRHGRLLRVKSTPTFREFSGVVGGCTTTTGCHSIQQPYPDGSVGRCGACHPTHTFSNHEARNPRVCYTCHAGADNPEYEIWLRSAHSFASPSGKADCVECHDTHDVSAGVTHGLSPVATESPPLFVPTLAMEVFKKEREVMLGRCRKCHGTRLAREALDKADSWRRRGALLVAEAGRIIRGLAEDGLLDPPPEGRIPNPVHGTVLRLGGTQIYDMDTSLPERIYYDMRFHLYPVLWRGAYHNDPERMVWEWNDALKSSLDRLRDIERRLRKKGKDR